MGQASISASKKKIKKWKKKLKALKKAYMEIQSTTNEDSKKKYLEKILQIKAKLKLLKHQLRIAENATRKRYKSYKSAIKTWRDNQQKEPATDFSMLPDLAIDPWTTSLYI